MKFIWIAGYVFFLLNISSVAQNPTNRQRAEKALSDKDYALATEILRGQINLFFDQNQPDSVPEYMYAAGKAIFLQSGFELAKRELSNWIELIVKTGGNEKIIRQAYLETGEFYGFAGKNKQAYEANLKALEHHRKVPGPGYAGEVTIQSNLSAYAQRTGNSSLAQHHARLSMLALSEDPDPDYEKLFFAYNNAGVQHWFASRMDSAKYYFLKSLDAVSKAPESPENRHYRPAILQNNLFGIYSFEGKSTEAISVAKACIENIKKYLILAEPGKKKTDALEFQFSATDNLAGVYKGLGNYQQAKELLQYSYEQKKTSLLPSDPAIFISEILLGQIHFALRDYDRARKYLLLGIREIGKADGDYLFWHADACNTLALIADAEKNIPEATKYYALAEDLYSKVSQGEYDNSFLELLRNSALFHAQNGNISLALEKGERGYRYVEKIDRPKTLQSFYQLLNLAGIHYEGGNYEQSIRFANRGIALLAEISRTSKFLLDSVKIETDKPKALLIKARSSYEMQKNRSETFLLALLKDLEPALEALERRKAALLSPEDIQLMMGSHRELFEFIKKLNLDLFRLTGNEKYAFQLIGLHESGIYHRIRSRLEKSDNISFAGLPVNISEREQQLKNNLRNALTGQGSHNEKMARYNEATQQWTKHLEMLRSQSPEYYQMRYERIFRPVPEIQQMLPANVSVVRYVFVGKELMALIVDKRKITLLPLGSPELEQEIATVSKNSTNISSLSLALSALYQKLWQPLEAHITNKKLVIVPDGILHTLNFEVLTPKAIRNLSDLATHSLLSTYQMSYQYSLFLVGQQKKPVELQKNFVAFVPGFSDQLKAGYRAARKDSLENDQSYFSLLPQPFTVALANKARELLNGDVYMNMESTVNSFRKYAGKNKIIHIGTHAESNNLHPEYSRLIFAKNPETAAEDNSLYLLDIYNCDLTSYLTVLTACESGRPGYQDGEGMISLAHAFNYAGSESIITGLWKIDEQSSNMLMDSFYDHLLQGMDKDEALRQAKLNYLRKNNGRMLAPQYWAGLVLMGNSDAIKISSKPGRNWLYVFVVAVFIAGLFASRNYFRKYPSAKKPSGQP